MASPFAILFGALVSTYVFLRMLLHYTQDPREPPAIAKSIPFISPILGMIAQKSQYYTRNRDKYGLPIYTLRMPGSRVYVINSTALITAVQRQFMTIAFAPIETKAAINVMGASEAGKAMLLENSDPKTGNWDQGYAVSYSKAIHPAMSPGDGLKTLNRAAIRQIADSIQTLREETPQIVELFGWVRHQVSHCTAEAVYGPLNPFRDSEVEEAFWKFGPGIVILLINLFPSVLAKESLKARQVLIKAFEKYFQNGGQKQGSALIKARYEHSMRFNASLTDLARFEIGGSIAVLASTGPAAFWLTYHIFSDPVVLEDIRNEASKLVVAGPNGRTIDLAMLNESCPILLSTFREVLRFHSIGTSARVVMEDHLLDGKYLLKKGSTVMIPGAVQHTSPSIWGDNVGEFYHKRFVQSDRKNRPNPVAFRGFGGGAHLCPGRHFASTEILGFTTLMVLQFDVAPAGGKWVWPTTEKSDMWLTVPEPDMDIVVEIIPRLAGTQGEKLNVIFSGSGKGMELVAEDMAD